MKKFPVTVDELAAHWKLTPRRVRQLADEIPIKRKGDVFDLIEADQKLIRWLQRDEPTKRAKRELLAWQRHRIEAAIAREDRQTMQPAEIKALIEDAWAALRQGHTSALSTLYNELKFHPEIKNPAHLVARLEGQVIAWLSDTRQRMESIYGGALQRMESVERNGILVCARRIAALNEAIGPDEDDDGDA